MQDFDSSLSLLLHTPPPSSPRISGGTHVVSRPRSHTSVLPLATSCRHCQCLCWLSASCHTPPALATLHRCGHTCCTAAGCECFYSYHRCHRPLHPRVPKLLLLPLLTTISGKDPTARSATSSHWAL